MWRCIVLITFFGLSLAQNATKVSDPIKLNNECGYTVEDEWKCCVSAFDATECLTLRFLREAMEIEVLVTVNDGSVIDKIISLRNPPPICVSVPYSKNMLAICLTFHDMDWSIKDLSGCVKFEAWFLGDKFTKDELGCFHFPLQKKEVLKLKSIMFKKVVEIKNIPHISVQLVT